MSHDRSRVTVQEKLARKISALENAANKVRDRLQTELATAVASERDRTVQLLERLAAARHVHGAGCVNQEEISELVAEVEKRLREWKSVVLVGTEPKHQTRNPERLLRLEVVPVQNSGLNKENLTLAGLYERLVEATNEQESARAAVADSIDAKCDATLKEVVALQEQVTRDLERLYTAEAKRLQDLVWEVNETWGKGSEAEELGLSRRVKVALVVEQEYSLLVRPKRRVSARYCLRTTKRMPMLEEQRITDVKVVRVEHGKAFLSFAALASDEEDALKEAELWNNFTVRALVREVGGASGRGKKVRCALNKKDCSIVLDGLKAKVTYSVKLKLWCAGKAGAWSAPAEFTTPEFAKLCAWKEYPGGARSWSRYFVDKENRCVVTKPVPERMCTAVGSTPLPLGKTVSWGIKILKAANNCGAIYIGVAPSGINQNEENNHTKCGWYFNCFNSFLCSGPPHNYINKEYGPRKKLGEYVRIGDTVGVVVDTTKGELSYVVSGANLGVAFDGIPLDKPLVPCVSIWWNGDIIEFVCL